MGSEKPWGRECLDIVETLIEINFNEGHNLLRMTREERVMIKFIPEAVGYCEGKGFKPCSSTLGTHSHDGVITARFEAHLELYDVLDPVRTEPIVLV